MKLVVGLGNPDKQYSGNRHNVGFMALDHFAAHHKLEFKSDSKSISLIAEFRSASRRTDSELQAILVKPQTFMNNSGKAVQTIAKFYKLDTNDILVVYDDTDLPFGTIRTRKGGSSAGHKGVESVIATMGRDFYRLRIGVRNSDTERIGIHDFVLSDFNKSEQDPLKDLFTYAQEHIIHFISTGELPAHTEIISNK